ncbi:DUF397 domain-containing protein [Nonomuraea sp. SYSU D8015]|uniref:DUF397 domain-containing protein n=1 Tax=Nonomuraea sp. SYSU D8015 TaxID=2593644 RepID=UPI0016605BEC|nr:DUF397 domain-containing protein [Nonomuraea sp. SYSU D8015]
MLGEDWVTASESGGCVEVRRGADGGVEVRNSRRPNGLVLSFTPEEWWYFVRGAHRGVFDLPEWHSASEG